MFRIAMKRLTVMLQRRLSLRLQEAKQMPKSRRLRMRAAFAYPRLRMHPDPKATYCTTRSHSGRREATTVQRWSSGMF